MQTSPLFVCGGVEFCSALCNSISLMMFTTRTRLGFTSRSYIPDGTLSLSSDCLSGRKKAEERVTVLVCANMDGTNKRPLLAIGKSRMPRCFGSVAQLPTSYMSSSNAWMTSDLFSKWLHYFNHCMVRENRHVLVVDNCSC